MLPIRTFVATFIAAAITASAHAGNWPGFRGPSGDGIANERGVPTRWSDSENIAWRIELKNPGNSSPIVWEDKLILASATADGSKRITTCYNRADGKILWEKFIEFTDDEPKHQTNTYSAATPVTDGQAVYVFHGSAGMVAYKLADGEELWKRDLGPVRHIWGPAASPVLFEDMVIQHVGPGVNVYLVALDKATGKTVWKKELEDAKDPDGGFKGKQWMGGWDTPVFYRSEGKVEMLLGLPKHVAGFNPQTGQEYWRCGGLTDLVYSNVVVGDSTIMAMSGYMGAAIGLRKPNASAKGDITSTHQLWRVAKNPQRIGTGVVIKNTYFTVEEPGIAKAIDMTTGKELFAERVGKTTWGSTVYVDGRLYTFDNTGTGFVWEPRTTFKLVTSNALSKPEMTRATPAYSDGQIFLRTYDHLYAIGMWRRGG
jgi:outer membrane protein assembly factor BamB